MSEIVSATMVIRFRMTDSGRRRAEYYVPEKNLWKVVGLNAAEMLISIGRAIEQDG